MAVYALHTSQVIFWERLIEQTDLSLSNEIVMMWDFNNVMDLELDRFSPKSLVCLPKVFLDWLKENRCIEVWRSFHQGKKDYIFFSGRHNSLSRIDYIIIPENWRKNVQIVDFGHRIHLHHASVVLIWQKGREPMARLWELNNMWLEDLVVKGKI